MKKSGSAVHKTLDILLLFNQNPRGLSIDEISQLIAMPRSTTYRYVSILGEKGFLEKDRSGLYRPGLHLMTLAQSALARTRRDLSEVALPIMEDIAQETGETVLLTRLSAGRAVCIERVEGPQNIRITFEVGAVQPLHAGASSKILLAHLDEDSWEQYISSPLERFTEFTITDPEALKADLHQIRQQVYCISKGEVDVGACAVAVPILDKKQQALAALSTAGPAFRMGDDVIAHHLEILHPAAERIADQFSQSGYRVPPR